eukprot:870329-Amphidinium_carterae.1
MVDSYLLHHVLVTSHACTAQETFCSGGVTTADRMHRHKGVCSDVCEHEGCSLRDTVDHRLYSCPSTSQHRRDLAWGDHEESVTLAQGYQCRQYGLWKVPNAICLSHHMGVLSLLREELVDWFLERLSTVPTDATLTIKFWTRISLCCHPMGTFAWAHTGIYEGARSICEKSSFCYGFSNRADLLFACFTLAWILATLRECSVVLEFEGSVNSTLLLKRALDPSDLWGSARFMCNRLALPRISCTSVVHTFDPLVDSGGWELSCRFRSLALTQEKQ